MWLNEGLDLALPDVSGAEYLLEWMAPECLGWCKFEAMGGAAAHSWAEIEAFSRASGALLEPWEASQIRAMSAAYVDGMARGGEPMKISPAFEDRPEDDPGVAVERRKVSEQMKSGLSALAGKG